MPRTPVRTGTLPSPADTWRLIACRPNTRRPSTPCRLPSARRTLPIASGSRSISPGRSSRMAHCSSWAGPAISSSRLASTRRGGIDPVRILLAKSEGVWHRVDSHGACCKRRRFGDLRCRSALLHLRQFLRPRPLLHTLFSGAAIPICACVTHLGRYSPTGSLLRCSRATASRPKRPGGSLL